jgi:AraC family transcriptional activator of mtrCDE
MMDALSRLLSLHPVRAALDIRCLRAAMEPAACGLASGGGALSLHPRGSGAAATGGGRALLLEAGDLVVLTRGAAHDLFIAPASSVARLGVAAPVQLNVNDEEAGGAQPRCRISSVDNSISMPRIPTPWRRRCRKSCWCGAGCCRKGWPAHPGHLLRNECGGADGRGELRAGAQAVVAGLAAALFGLRAWLARGGPRRVAGAAGASRPASCHAGHAGCSAAGWTLPRLATLCHMSRATFVRRFQEVGGTTPGEPCSSCAWRALRSY